MPESLSPTRFLVLSAAAHAALVALLVPVFGGPVGERGPTRVDTGVDVPVLLEDPPVLPEAAEPAPPAARDPVREAEALAESIPEAVDPRFAGDDAPAPGPAPADGAGILGIGGGGRRLRPSRFRPGPASSALAAAAPAPAPEEAPPPPAPIVPSVRARPAAGACAPPPYPAVEKRLGIEGVVGLRVSVAADGSVGGVEVASSSGEDGLDAAAAEAVRGWRFEPALLDGAPVADVVVLSVRFRLVSAAHSGRDGG